MKKHSQKIDVERKPMIRPAQNTSGKVTSVTSDIKIHIEIENGENFTGLNYVDFDRAILGLINEREWYNYWKKEEMKKILSKEKTRREKKNDF